LNGPLRPRNSGYKSCFHEVIDYRGIEDALGALAGTVGGAKPNELWWLAVENAPLLKVRILGNDCETVVLGMLPNSGIVCVPQSATMNVNGPGINIRQHSGEAGYLCFSTYRTRLTARSLRVQSQQWLRVSQVFEDEVLPGTGGADEPAEEMSERQDHGKKLSGKDRIKLCAKSFILQVYDVLAKHSQR
jgi:hypothetical protein